MRILIVDDNESLRRLLSSLFVNVGHEVVSMVADGSKQVEAEIQRTQPDIVCLDYNLPGRDGITILHAIQSMAPQIDILFMTGSNETDLEQRAADAGASGFIRKPFGQAQIVRELSNVCETRKYAPRAANQIPASANSASPKAVSQNNDSPRGRRGKAVIADDSAAIRLVLKGLLEECGLQVVQSVANGATDPGQQPEDGSHYGDRQRRKKHGGRSRQPRREWLHRKAPAPGARHQLYGPLVQATQTLKT